MGLELSGVAPPRARVSGETALVGIYEISKLLASPARLENVLAGVDTPRFALAGHSMGGRVALEVARLAPQRVERLALLDTGYQPRNPSTDLDDLRRQFLSTHYHQPSDDLALPIDYPTAADLARINLRIVLSVANASGAPRWSNGDFFAEKFPKK